MSWKDAKTAGSHWLQRLQLPADLKGQKLELEKLCEELPHQGTYRKMVVRAITRELRFRGAKVE
jgi:hypothetical protein